LGQGSFYREYYGQTTLHPLGLIVVLVCGIAVLALPRRYAMWPFVVVACFVAPAQRIVIFSLNFTLLRVMVVFGTLRVLAKGEGDSFKWTRMDSLVLMWSAYAFITDMVVHMSVESMKYELGIIYDFVGMYFVFRILVRDWDNLSMLVRSFAVISVPIAAAFLIENRTGRNLFAFLGGVPEITMVREGRLRCQGAFAHPILAGCFWASVLPLILAEWWHGGIRRQLVVVGGASALIIVVLSASSTPVLGVVCIILGALCFPFRRYMRTLRWTLLLTLIFLHMVMNKPVWHLIARMSAVGGSTGYHRYLLIDQALTHVDEWWLLGSSVGSAHWGEGMEDTTNMYVVWGLHGGLGLLSLFIAMISVGFGNIGRIWRAWSSDPAKVIMAWGLGLSLLVHTASFVGTSYFGQINMLWALDLAIIASLGLLPRPAGLWPAGL